MNNLFENFCKSLGMSEEQKKDFMNGITVKYVENGETLIDIENGVDKLATEVKEEVPPTSPAFKPVPSNESCEEPLKEEKPAEGKSTVPTEMWLRDDLFMIDENTFIATNKVNENLLDGVQTEITFSHKTSNDCWVPGLTEEQLLAILLVRHRDDKNKIDAIKSLIY